MAVLPCAHRCPDVDAAIRQHARTDLEHRSARLALGLTPIYVPIEAVCPKCGHVWDRPSDAEACGASD